MTANELTTGSTKLAAAVLVASVVAAAPASAIRNDVAAPGAFSGKVCGLVKSGALDAADISAPCHQLPTRKLGSLGTAWTANWGTQLVKGGADHFLGVSVIKFSAPAAAKAWQAAQRYPAQIRIKGVVAFYKTFPYNSIVNGPEKKGAQGGLSAVTKSGYGIMISLFDRPATDSDVKAGMIIVAGQVVPAVK